MSHNGGNQEFSSNSKGRDNDNQDDGNRILSDPNRKGAVWMFSGLGSAWLDMGKELLANEPVFRKTVVDLDEVLMKELGFSGLEALEQGKFDTTDTGQILIPVMQIALATFLKSKGARPSAVIGHSVGEIPAAVVAGAITAKEGLTIACRCSLLYKKLRGDGAMLIVTTRQVNGVSAFDQIDAMLQGRDDIGVALELSPIDCVVSGRSKAISDFDREWRGRVTSTTLIDTSMPFHSPLLRPHEGHVKATLEGITLNPRPPKIPIYSTSAINPRTKDPRNATYWLNNTLSPVRLSAAVRTAAEDGHRAYLEVSPHPLVTKFVPTTLSTVLPTEEKRLVLPSMIRDEGVLGELIYCMNQMWDNGVAMDPDWQSRIVSDDL